MKNRITLIALGLCLAAAPALAADAPAKKPAAAKAKYSMEVNGRYHKVHKAKAGLDCSDCHDKNQTDIQYLRKDDPTSAELAKVGQVDRNGCLNCHTPGEKKKGKIPSFWGV